MFQKFSKPSVRLRVAAFALILLYKLVSVSGMALAQETVETDHLGETRQTKTVDESRIFEYERLSMRAGAWQFYPDISTELQFSDNIFYSDNVKESDIITVIEPTLRVSYNRPDQIVDLFVKSRNGIYADNTAENYSNNMVSVNFNQEVSRGFDIRAKSSYSRAHKDRNSEDSLESIAEPTRYTHYNTILDLTYQKGRYGITTGIEWQHYSFSNTDGVIMATVINNDRDRDEWYARLGLQYDINRDYQAFVKTEINRIDYERPDYIVASADYVGVKRDSSGFNILAGARFNPTPLIRADLGIGYLEQSYDDPSLDGIDGIAIEASADWNISPITTVSAGLYRSVKETAATGSSGFVSTQSYIRLAHKFRRNMKLSVFSEYETNSYEQITRDDDISGIGFALNYKLNRSTGMIFEYRYDRRDSSIKALDYTRSLFTVSLKYQF